MEPTFLIHTVDEWDVGFIFSSDDVGKRIFRKGSDVWVESIDDMIERKMNEDRTRWKLTKAKKEKYRKLAEQAHNADQDYVGDSPE